MALSSAQIVRIVIFLKEAAAHIDNARLVAQRAEDRRTEEGLAALLSGIVSEITQLEILRHNVP